jgi:hypothetical protein
VARSRLRCGARVFPFLITSDRIPGVMSGLVVWKNKKAPSVSEEARVIRLSRFGGRGSSAFATSCPPPRSHADKPHDKEGNKDEANEDERGNHEIIVLNSE